MSVFCAQAGAAKVYAVEPSDMHVIAEAVVKENNMQEIVQVIHERVEDIKLDIKVDFIVSEWMGYFLLVENMLPFVLIARDRFLKPGGIMLPSEASIYLAPISDSSYFEKVLGFWDTVPQTFGISMLCIKSLAQRCAIKNVNWKHRSSKSLVAPSCKIVQFDLNTITASEVLKVHGSFDFTCTKEDTVHGFVGWFDVKLSDNITMSTSPFEPKNHWKQCALNVDESFN